MFQAADNMRASFHIGMVDLKNPIYGYAENVEEFSKNFYRQKGKLKVEARSAFLQKFQKARLARNFGGASGATGGEGVLDVLPTNSEEQV